MCLSTCMFLCYTHARYIQRPEEGIGYSKTGVTNRESAIWLLRMRYGSSAEAASALYH